MKVLLNVCLLLFYFYWVQNWNLKQEEQAQDKRDFANKCMHIMHIDMPEM